MLWAVSSNNQNNLKTRFHYNQLKPVPDVFSRSLYGKQRVWAQWSLCWISEQFQLYHLIHLKSWKSSIMYSPAPPVYQTILVKNTTKLIEISWRRNITDHFTWHQSETFELLVFSLSCLQPVTHQHEHNLDVF